MKKKLEAVRYSSRYALALFYDEGASLNLPFNASYLYEDPIFRFIAIDNLKRNRRKLLRLFFMFFNHNNRMIKLAELPISLVLHTSVPFGLKHIDRTVKEVEPILMSALEQSFPDLPPPKAVKCQKWKFSQVLA